MFELSVPVWELLVRAALVYFGLLVLIRLSGKRTIGEFSPFDVIVMLLLAEAAEGALMGGEESVPGALIVVATLIALNYAVAFVSTRSKRFEQIVEGQPVILIKKGELVPGGTQEEQPPRRRPRRSDANRGHSTSARCGTGDSRARWRDFVL